MLLLQRRSYSMMTNRELTSLYYYEESDDETNQN